MKKKLLFLLLPLLAAVWLAGCKEKNASGQVLEFGTDKPIANATLTLRACEGEVLGSFDCTDVDTTTSDADGNFCFDQDGTIISGSATGFWESDDNFAFINRDGGPLPVTLRLYPHGWLKVKLVNSSGSYQITAPWEKYSLGNRSFYLTQGGDTTIYSFQKGNKEFKYLFSVVPNQGGAANLNLNDFTILNGASEITPSLINSTAPWFNIYMVGHDTTKIIIIY